LLARNHPEPSRRGRRCPDEELLVAWATGKLAGYEREHVETHIAGCDFCLGQVGFLARADGLGEPPAAPARLLEMARGGRARRFVPARHVALTAAAAAVFVAAFAILLPRGAGRTQPVGAPSPGPQAMEPADRPFRNGLPATAAPHFLRPAEGETVPRAALLFAWKPAPEALSYTLEVVSSDGDVVWEGESANPRVAPPPGVALAPGRTYFAWVLTHLRSGAVERSPAVGFRVAPD